MASSPPFPSQALHDSAKLLAELAPRTVLDTAAVVTAGALLGAYFLADHTWNKPDPYQYIWYERPQEQGGGSHSASQTTRNIAERLKELVSSTRRRIRGA
jgi:NADPH-ferrihemoprotein reductase